MWQRLFCDSALNKEGNEKKTEARMIGRKHLRCKSKAWTSRELCIQCPRNMWNWYNEIISIKISNVLAGSEKGDSQNDEERTCKVKERAQNTKYKKSHETRYKTRRTRARSLQVKEVIRTSGSISRKIKNRFNASQFYASATSGRIFHYAFTREQIIFIMLNFFLFVLLSFLFLHTDTVLNVTWIFIYFLCKFYVNEIYPLPINIKIETFLRK